MVIPSLANSPTKNETSNPPAPLKPSESQAPQNTNLDGDSDNTIPAEDNTTPTENITSPTEGDDSSDIRTDTGSYIGQADSNSIEIKISGIADGNYTFRVFQISEGIKQTFESLSLETNEQVLVNYYEHANGQNILTNIERITP